MEYALEVITLPVTDIDGAKAFYVERLGFREDVDYSPSPDFRVVQLTPSGSAASIQFGAGLTQAAPGTVRSTYLVVKDIEEAHAELLRRAAPVSEIFHKKDRATWAGQFTDGIDPDRAPYASFFDFSDPDGNHWIVQERSDRGV